MSLEVVATTKILFIGDSITDCGRRNDHEGIGDGYVRIVRDYLRATVPKTAPIIVNQGISGNRIIDLADRWQSDVLDHAPDILSIKIGVNDVCHGLGGRNEGVDVDRFVRIYDNLLRMVATLLPECALVLCEPSVIWPPQPVDGNEKLRPYVAAVHALAEKFEAECVVPLHQEFEKANLARPDIPWAPDGVHPSSSGHMLIARAWLKTTELW